MRIGKHYSILLLLSLLSSQVWAADSPTVRQWLEKMSRAAHELNYDGTFVYLQDKQMTAMRITHTVDATGENERIELLNGIPGPEAKHDNTSATVNLGQTARHKKGGLRKNFPQALSEDIAQLENYYQFVLRGQHRVAGRVAQIILVKPADQYRYGYRLWVDVISGLLLKADMVNETGASIEQVMFTAINFENVEKIVEEQNPAQAADQHPGKGKVIMPAVQQPSAATDWRITQLPKGFRRVEHNQYTMESGDAPVEHIVLTDGLASISVFIEESDPDDKFVGVSHRGAVNAFGTISNDHQITLVGEVPLAAVKLIGQSIQYQKVP